MLDAYIIDRIRRERERREEHSRAQIPLYIPVPPLEPSREEPQRRDEVGETEVDYRI